MAAHMTHTLVRFETLMSTVTALQSETLIKNEIRHVYGNADSQVAGRKMAEDTHGTFIIICDKEDR